MDRDNILMNLPNFVEGDFDSDLSWVDNDLGCSTESVLGFWLMRGRQNGQRGRT